jgi:hypothetical protein
VVIISNAFLDEKSRRKSSMKLTLLFQSSSNQTLPHEPSNGHFLHILGPSLFDMNLEVILKPRLFPNFFFALSQSPSLNKQISPTNNCSSSARRNQQNDYLGKANLLDNRPTKPN